MTSLILTT